MKRVALTIVLNGLHHFMHQDFTKNMLDIFDHWIIVEGASKSTGSTNWCNNMPIEFHNNGLSVDGTTEFLSNLSIAESKIIHIKAEGLWKNKDHQINAGITEIRKITNKCFLWEIDVDEQWTKENIESAEKILVNSNAKTGCFLCNYYVGEGLIAMGDWGEGKALPWRRLWNWSGENFETHEPPRLVGGNGKGILIPIKFSHYAYYFEKDVAFKDKWYSGHEGILERWKQLQVEDIFPQHVSKLLGTKTHWGQTNTTIIRL